MTAIPISSAPKTPRWFRFAIEACLWLMFGACVTIGFAAHAHRQAEKRHVVYCK